MTVDMIEATTVVTTAAMIAMIAMTVVHPHRALLTTPTHRDPDRHISNLTHNMFDLE